MLAISLASYAEEDAAPIVRVGPSTEREELQVQPGMALRVRFACSPEVFQSVVDADGRVTLGHLGEMKVADLTFTELGSLLELHAQDSLMQFELRADNGTWSLVPARGTTCNPTGDFPDPTGPKSG